MTDAEIERNKRAMTTAFEDIEAATLVVCAHFARRFARIIATRRSEIPAIAALIADCLLRLRLLAVGQG